MVQIIEENRPRRALGGFLGNLVNAGAGAYSQMRQEAEEKNRQKEMMQQQQQLMHQQNLAAKNMGVDLSGITDPRIRQEAVKSALEGRQKEELFNKKQGFLSQLFSGQQPEQQNNSGEMRESGQQSGLNPADLTDQQIAYATSIDPNLGRSLQHSKDIALREKSAERARQIEERKLSPEFKREQALESGQASSDIKFNESIQEGAKQQKLKQQSLNNLQKLNEKGVTGKPYEKLLERMGLINLTSDGRREFAADVKNLITDIRSILGAQFTGFEFQTILNAYPSADFSKEANAAIIRNLQSFQDIKNKEVQFANELKKENSGKIPYDFQSKVNERVEKYAQSKLAGIKENTKQIMNEEYGIKPGNILMFDPQGEPLEVSSEDVDRFQSLGATLP